MGVKPGFGPAGRWAGGVERGKLIVSGRFRPPDGTDRRNSQTGVPNMPVDFTMPVANPRLLPHRAGIFAASGRPPHRMMLVAGCGVTAAPMRTGHDLRLR